MSEPVSHPRDRSRYVIPLTVAVIAAIATIAAAVLPQLLSDEPSSPSPTSSAGSPPPAAGEFSAGVTEAGRVWVEGFHVLAAMFGSSADLDADPSKNRGDKVPDIVVTREALRISDGARLALLNKNQTPRSDTCTAEIAKHAVDSVAEPNIQPGTSLCYQTSAGRIGMLTIGQARKTTQNDVSTIYILNVEYVTWSG